MWLQVSILTTVTPCQKTANYNKRDLVLNWNLQGANKKIEELELFILGFNCTPTFTVVCINEHCVKKIYLLTRMSDIIWQMVILETSLMEVHVFWFTIRYLLLQDMITTFLARSLKFILKAIKSK